MDDSSQECPRRQDNRIAANALAAVTPYRAYTAVPVRLKILDGHRP
jgi:hypothetical protein